MRRRGKLGGQKQGPSSGQRPDHGGLVARIQYGTQRTAHEDCGHHRRSGSGKSTVLNGLKDHFEDRLSMLSLDDYYRPKEVLPVDANGGTNFDVPGGHRPPHLHTDMH